MEALCACVRGTRARHGRPGAPAWLVVRRSTAATPELNILLSNAPAPWAHAALVRVSGLRWPVEPASEAAKGAVGRDPYATRPWRGWHHHMTQTLLAHHVVVRGRLHGKKKRQP
jgi:SRSO17 transposase